MKNKRAQMCDSCVYRSPYKKQIRKAWNCQSHPCHEDDEAGFLCAGSGNRKIKGTYKGDSAKRNERVFTSEREYFWASIGECAKRILGE